MSMEFVSRRPEGSPLPGEPIPYVLAAGEGEHTQLLQSVVTVLASGDETGGSFGVYTLRAGMDHGLPTLRHEGTHVLVHVVRGAAQLVARSSEGELVSRELAAGDTGVVPAGSDYTLRVTADDSLLLVVCSPGWERFTATIGQPAADDALPSAPVLPSMEQFVASATEFGTSLRPPVA